MRRVTVTCIAWLDPRLKNTLIVIVEAIASDGLATAPRTWLKITSDLVKCAARNAAIITRRETQVVFPLAIAQAIIHL